jgi:hypothetical protein
MPLCHIGERATSGGMLTVGTPSKTQRVNSSFDLTSGIRRLADIPIFLHFINPGN